MKTSRRKFAAIIGTSVLAPALIPIKGMSIWERAEWEVEQTGEVSADLVNTLLDLQGTRGIYEDPKEFESLRVAITRAIPEHKSIRNFKVPQDTEPLLSLKR